jgi:hypothetical protein
MAISQTEDTKAVLAFDTPTLTNTSIPTDTLLATGIVYDCGPPGDWVLYVVKEGDTVASLVSAYGIPETAFLKASCLVEGMVLLGGMDVFVPNIPTYTPEPLTQTSPPLPTATETPKPPTATETTKPSPTSDTHPPEIVGEYICTGHEWGMLAFAGCLSLYPDGTANVRGLSGEWIYDEFTRTILFSGPACEDIDIVNVSPSGWPKGMIVIILKPGTTWFHAQTGKIWCEQSVYFSQACP